MGRVLELVWPRIALPTEQDREEAIANEKKDVEEIRVTSWPSAEEVALDQARLLVQEEEERRRTAESKATNALLLVGTLVPLLTYLLATVYGEGVLNMPDWILLPPLAIAVVYLLTAAFWAFHAVAPGNYHRVHVSEFTGPISKSSSPLTRLTQELLIAVRLNQDTINAKVDKTRRAQSFIFRATLLFSVLVFVTIGWGIWSDLVAPLIQPLPDEQPPILFSIPIQV